MLTAAAAVRSHDAARARNVVAMMATDRDSTMTSTPVDDVRNGVKLVSYSDEMTQPDYTGV